MLRLLPNRFVVQPESDAEPESAGVRASWQKQKDKAPREALSSLLGARTDERPQPRALREARAARAARAAGAADKTADTGDTTEGDSEAESKSRANSKRPLLTNSNSNLKKASPKTRRRKGRGASSPPSQPSSQRRASPVPFRRPG